MVNKKIKERKKRPFIVTKTEYKLMLEVRNGAQALWVNSYF